MSDHPSSAQDSPRRPGRPRDPEPSSVVYTRLPTSTYDALIRRALAQDVSVCRLVRDLLVLRLKP